MQNNICEYGYSDCINIGEKCHLCSVKGLHYKPPKEVKKGLNKSAPKITKRGGSVFEYNNNKANNSLLSGVTSRQTPNSGAGQIKGDEQISGIINIMEELKEQNKLTSRGEKTFTIQKEWLEKLKREAIAENKEFWYLKFIFSGTDKDVYCILDSDMVMSMVYTMVEDRRTKIKADLSLDVAKKENELLKAKLLTADKANDLLKAQIKLLSENLNNGQQKQPDITNDT